MVGALAVVLALSWFGFGLEAIDDAVTASNGFTIGETYDVSATVAFTPVDGWVLDPKQTVPEIAVVAHKNGWEQKLAAGLDTRPRPDGRGLRGRLPRRLGPECPGRRPPDVHHHQRVERGALGGTRRQ